VQALPGPAIDESFPLPVRPDLALAPRAPAGTHSFLTFRCLAHCAPPIVASSKDEMTDWVHVMRGPRQKGSKRKRRGKEKAHNSSNGAGGPAPPESPEKAVAVAGDDSLDSTYSPPAWVGAFSFSGPWLGRCAAHSRYFQKKEGWLWVKSSRPGDVWSSYYCLANEYTFEWFKRGVKVPRACTRAHTPSDMCADAHVHSK
jgi:hypothetical protein